MAKRILEDKKSLKDMGVCFGADFYQAELDYLIKHEWVASVDAALWRRTKMGLKLTKSAQEKIEKYIQKRLGK